MKTFVLMHGRDRRLTTIGKYPIISLQDARAEAKRLLAEATLGKHLPKCQTFLEVVDLPRYRCGGKQPPWNSE